MQKGEIKMKNEKMEKIVDEGNNSRGKRYDIGGNMSITLPELIEEHQELAATEESIAWVWGLLGNYRPGDIHDTGDGVMLQKVTFDTARCIRVFDHPVPMYELSMLQSLFDNAKANLEIGLCTVITPVPEEIGEGMAAKSQATTPKEKKVAEAPSPSEDATKSSDYNVGMEVA
jgi:hypothetical protein